MPLYFGFADYEKAFDRKKLHNKTIAIAIDHLKTDLIPIDRGIREGDTISPKSWD